MKNENRANDWLRQAENDFEWGKDSLRSLRYAQTCFIAQQVSEKALKALGFHRGFSKVKGHPVYKIAKALSINGEVERIAGQLDQYYISSRYPDALPSGAPFDGFLRNRR